MVDVIDGSSTSSDIDKKNLDDQERLVQANAYLLNNSSENGTSLYNHIVEVLSNIINEKPDNAADVFENIHQKARSENSEKDPNLIDRSTEVALSEIQHELFKREEEEEMETEEDVNSPLPNMHELAFFFEQAGVGIGREETVRVWLALKNLVDQKPLQTVRFWGKILGAEQNYYIAEVEYREGDDVEEEDVEEEDIEEEAEKESEEREEEEDKFEFPKPDYKEPPVIPKEEKGTGVNKKTYFVCNDPGKPWIKLPSVTPVQIQISREIKKFFTGRLDAPIVTYPPFPGNESNYLRAQIARISAGTHISPLDFYQFDEEAVEDEDGEGPENFVEYADFKGIPISDMIESGFNNWVHHVQHILPQGRCTWFNPAQKNENDYEGEEEEETEDMDEPKREKGPPLLQPLSMDIALGGVKPWSANISSSLVPQHAIAVVHSNLWPGAHAFAVGNKFENIYLGWGHKYTANNYTPIPPPSVQDEYTVDHIIKEDVDPTPEVEEAHRAARQQEEEGGEMLETDEEEEDD